MIKKKRPVGIDLKEQFPRMVQRVVHDPRVVTAVIVPQRENVVILHLLREEIKEKTGARRDDTDREKLFCGQSGDSEFPGARDRWFRRLPQGKRQGPTARRAEYDRVDTMPA